MRLSPGSPLHVGSMHDEAQAITPVASLAMAGGLAQLEWTRAVIEAGARIDPLRYPAIPGLHAARGRAFDGLHGFLADSLPDAWGRLLMRRRLERLGIRIETLDAVDRLALVGNDGRGALVYRPATTPRHDSATIDLDTLAEQSHALLRGDDVALLDTLARLGGASGGARPKVHLDLASDDDHGGSGSDAWIVKFRATHDPIDIGAIEEGYARMARLAGIVMADSRLLPSRDGPGWFATRRFDRPAPGRRVHMVSLAGAVEAPSEVPSIDYDGFLRATLAITRHAADVTEAFRRMVFNVFSHNRDDHSRQHSYLMRADGDWRLAPAYDLTFAHGPGGEHYMAVAGEGRTPTRAQITMLGQRHGQSAPTIAAIIDAVRAALAAWPAIADEVGVGPSRAAIDERLAHVAASFG